jgi:hypothetical protein
MREANPPLDCQLLSFEDGEAIANGDIATLNNIQNKEIICLSKWLGLGLPIEDKTFKAYNRHPVIYLYWRVSYVIAPPIVDILISIGMGEMWHLPINLYGNATLNEFLIKFFPLYLARAKLEHHPLGDLDGDDYYRHDWFEFYLFPKDHDELDEKIVDTLVGDHPLRLGRCLHRVPWGGVGQDTPMLQFLTNDTNLLVTPCRGRVHTPHTRLRELISSTPSPLGYHRSIDGLVERLRHRTMRMSNNNSFIQDLDNAPNDSPLEDKYLLSFTERIMTARLDKQES